MREDMAYSTKFRCVCPKCDRVSRMVWRHEENMVRCPHCREVFDYRSHTYRPVTGGMTEDERTEYLKYKDWSRAYDRTPARLEAHAFRSRRYYHEHREKIRAKDRERYREHRDEINAKRRARYAENREEMLAKRRAYDAKRTLAKLREKRRHDA